MPSHFATDTEFLIKKLIIPYTQIPPADEYISCLQFLAASTVPVTWMPWRDGTLASTVPTRMKVKTCSAVGLRHINTAAPKRIKSYRRKCRSKGQIIT